MSNKANFFMKLRVRRVAIDAQTTSELSPDLVFSPELARLIRKLFSDRTLREELA